MAEGGDENEDNPFSFKKFVTPREKENDRTEENENSTVNGQGLGLFPDIGDSSTKNRRKERATLVISEDEPKVQVSTSKTKKKKNGEGNPFSFKKFLSGSSTCSSSGGARPKNYNTQSAGGKRTTPDFASDLPDFVQDHFSEHTQDFNLPDFAVPSQLHNTNQTSHDPECSSDNIFSASNDNHNNSHSDDEDKPVVIATGGTSSLPDFLSDGILKSDCEHTENRISTYEVNGDHELELRRLREENSILRTQLEEARREAVTESQRCHKMKKNMEDIQKKEAEENAALENMVQQIEANLTITTKRANQAETTVTKLQSEVKSLQKQVTALRGENDLLRSGDHGLSEIRERTKYSSEQLTTAANTAEQSLKQLLQGVDQMKILAQVLSSIDKITEEQSDEQSSEGQNNKSKHKQNKDNT